MHLKFRVALATHGDNYSAGKFWILYFKDFVHDTKGRKKKHLLIINTKYKYIVL
jgi:hypothetical protein